MSIYRFPNRDDGHHQPVWQHRLDAASTEADVVELANEFLATLTPGDIARLPEEARPRPIATADDVTRYAFLLFRHHDADDDGAARLIYRIARFFSGAAIRVSQVMARSSDPEEGRESA